MTDDWIPIKKMAPPAKTPCRILMYTPGNEDTKYRLIDISDWKKLTEATHWQPVIGPINSH